MNSLKVGFLLAVLVVLCPFAMWGQTNAVKTILGQHNISGLLDGQGTLAKFNNPASVVFNNTGSVPTVMYVADKDNNAIRAVVLATNQVTTIAGSGIAGWADGTGVNARFNAPSGIAIDKINSYLYVADSINGAIRKINIASGTVTTIIGKSCSSGPTIDNAQASNGGCYSTGDFMNGYIPGSGTSASFAQPVNLIMSYAAPMASSLGGLWVTDFIGNVSSVDLSASPPVMRLANAIDPSGNSASSCTAGGGCASYSFQQVYGIAQDSSNNLYVSVRSDQSIWQCIPGGSLSALASCSRVAGVATAWLSVDDTDGNGEYWGWQVDETNGTPLTAAFSNPAGLAFDANAQILYVADSANNVIRGITFVGGAAANVVTIAGHGVVTTANGDPDNYGTNPVGVPLTDTSVCALYTCGPPSGAGWADGNGTSAVMNYPTGVAIRYNRFGSQLFIADQQNQVIRSIGDPASYTLSGPSSGAINTPATFTYTPNFTANETVTITISGGGLNTTKSLTFTNSSTAQTFPITPTAAGTVTLTASSPSIGITVDANSLSYTVYAAPTVTGVSPSGGLPAGGTSVTITGTNFTGATGVTFGGTAATNVVVVSATSITAKTPAKTAGAVSVVVTTPGGTNAANTLYTYQAAPTVTSTNTTKISIRATSVTITGTGFDTTAANNAVVFNLSAVGTVTSATSTLLTVTLSTLPSTTGSLTAVVTTNGINSGSAVPVATVVNAPTVTLSTVGHSINGGTITLTGTGFHATAASNTVTFNNGAVGTVTSATTTQLSVTFSTQPTAVGNLTAAVTAYTQLSDTVQVATIVQPKITSFGFDGTVKAVVVDGNGKAYVGGDFSAWGPLSGAGAMVDTYSGAVETAFPLVNGNINAVIPDGSGGWYIGGSFTQVDQITRNYLAHMLSTGTVDPNWNPNANGTVNALAISGSTVYVGGSFTTVGGSTTRNRLAAFNATSGTATSWDPNASGGTVYALAISGSTVYAGGASPRLGARPLEIDWRPSTLRPEQPRAGTPTQVPL